MNASEFGVIPGQVVNQQDFQSLCDHLGPVEFDAGTYDLGYKEFGGLTANWSGVGTLIKGDNLYFKDVDLQGLIFGVGNWFLLDQGGDHIVAIKSCAFSDSNSVLSKGVDTGRIPILKVESNTFTGTKIAGLTLDLETDEGYVRNNQFSNCAPLCYQIASFWGNITVQGNRFLDLLRGHDPKKVKTYNLITTRSSTIRDNYFSNMNYSAMYIGGHDNVVERNVIEGFDSISSSQAAVIMKAQQGGSNVFNNNRISTIEGGAFYAEQNGHLEFKGNTLEGSVNKNYLFKVHNYNQNFPLTIDFDSTIKTPDNGIYVLNGGGTFNGNIDVGGEAINLTRDNGIYEDDLEYYAATKAARLSQNIEANNVHIECSLVHSCKPSSIVKVKATSFYSDIQSSLFEFSPITTSTFFDLEVNDATILGFYNLNGVKDKFVSIRGKELEIDAEILAYANVLKDNLGYVTGNCDIVFIDKEPQTDKIIKLKSRGRFARIPAIFVVTGSVELVIKV